MPLKPDASLGNIKRKERIGQLTFIFYVHAVKGLQRETIKIEFMAF
jgi:hypothetical protein